MLRRYRPEAVRDGLVEREALVMRHLADHGFPVPEVFDAASAPTSSCSASTGTRC